MQKRKDRRRKINPITSIMLLSDGQDKGADVTI